MSAHHRQIPTYSVDDALAEMASAGVDGAVIHPPSALGEAVNALAVEAVRRHPDEFCILGHFDLESPDRETIVARWRERPGMLGFRFTFNQPHQKAWWTDGSLDWLWAACEKAQLPVGLLAAGAHMAVLATIAERHPRLKLHIDHLGRGGGGAGITDDAAFADLEDMLALARFPNVGVKMSGCAELFEPALPVPEHPRLFAADLRGVRARALVLGHRHHPHAVLVSPMRDDVHRGAAVAPGPRPRARDGWRRRRLARLEATRREGGVTRREASARLRPGAHHRQDLLGIETKPGFGQVEGRATETERRGQLEVADDAAPLVELLQDPVRRAPDRDLHERGHDPVHADLQRSSARRRRIPSRC
ncbi:MAG: amidohydrolase family protein [Candidatus Rokubacteria bacterium]|nr:amidohydrolase family protein [Candidatus Rokubacteria bacterium]